MTKTWLSLESTSERLHFSDRLYVTARPLFDVHQCPKLSLSLPFTLSPTHLHTRLHTQTHFSTICRHRVRASSEERAQSGVVLAARGPWGLDLPISPSAYALLLQPCGLLKLSPRAGLWVYDSRDAQSVCVWNMFTWLLSLSHRAVFLGSSIRQLRGLKKATSINIPPAKICPMVWSVDGTCRQNEKKWKYISMCIYTCMSVSIQCHFWAKSKTQRSIFRVLSLRYIFPQELSR